MISRNREGRGPSNSLRAVALVAVLGLVLAGCSDEPKAAPVEDTDGFRVTTPAALTPTAPPEMIVEGKRYPLTYATCAQGLWDKRVDEWNQLVVAGKTGGVDQVASFKAKGWPVSFKATLDDPATGKVCPR